MCIQQKLMKKTKHVFMWFPAFWYLTSDANVVASQNSAPPPYKRYWLVMWFWVVLRDHGVYLTGWKWFCRFVFLLVSWRGAGAVLPTTVKHLQFIVCFLKIKARQINILYILVCSKIYLSIESDVCLCMRLQLGRTRCWCSPATWLCQTTFTNCCWTETPSLLVLGMFFFFSLKISYPWSVAERGNDPLMAFIHCLSEFASVPSPMSPIHLQAFRLNLDSLLSTFLNTC